MSEVFDQASRSTNPSTFPCNNQAPQPFAILENAKTHEISSKKFHKYKYDKVDMGNIRWLWLQMDIEDPLQAFLSHTE